RLVVAVPVQERLACEPGRLDALLLQELREVVRLLAEPQRVLVVREQLSRLVLEDRRAARLDADDRDAGAQVVAQRADRPTQVALGEVEEAVVVQGPAAAEPLRRQRDAVAERLERLDRGDADVDVEEAV